MIFFIILKKPSVSLFLSTLVFLTFLVMIVVVVNSFNVSLSGKLVIFPLILNDNLTSGVFLVVEFYFHFNFNDSTFFNFNYSSPIVNPLCSSCW